MKIDKRKVLMAMSGGVDSSTSAALLLEKGYEVIGISFLSLNPENDVNKGNFDKINETVIKDAKKVCDYLNIPHHVADLSNKFKEIVIDYFINNYMTGRTPNPCAKCNPNIKWAKLLEKADELGAGYLATGHYAKVRYESSSGRYILSRGYDSAKDQSYMLWGLIQDMLARTIFPLGNFSKDITREIASVLDLHNKDKSDSQENCFIINMKNYHEFIRDAVPDIDEKIGKGDIIRDGVKVGEHSGYPFYTIGQRKGLGIRNGEALYINEIIPDKNLISVGPLEKLYHKKLLAANPNLIKYSSLDSSKLFDVKVRYNDETTPARCQIDDNNMLHIEFTESKRAITPGQSVVIYEGDDVVGGAVIEKWLG